MANKTNQFTADTVLELAYEIERVVGAPCKHVVDNHPTARIAVNYSIVEDNGPQAIAFFDAELNHLHTDVYSML